MVTAALLGKDVREHGAAAIGLLLASLALVALAIAQNRAAAFSMSPFEVIRFSLITFVPLIVLTLGNRLIVREYLSGTRLFVESLPVGTVWPLTLKYLLGAAYLFVLGVMLVALSALGSSAADDVSLPWLALLLAKTMVVLLLYWSIVFCFSLCGHLRIVLYLVLLGIVALVAWLPAIDSTRFAPFQLLDRDLFVFERDVVPVAEMVWTSVLAVLFTLAGFLIARVGNGSVADRLARPMTRRDYVVLGVLFTGAAALAAIINEDRTRDPIRFGNTVVLRSVEPAMEMFYAGEVFRERSSDFFNEVRSAVEPMQVVLGIDSLPITRLALRPMRDPHDIDYGTLDGVYMSANWLENDSYDDAVLVAVVLHGLLSARTGGRAPFEPYHWILDGFTRWWSETLGEPDALVDTHRHELLARAVFVTSRLDENADLVESWQLIADGFGYPSAEALAFSAMQYLTETEGAEAVLALGRAFLSEPVDASLLASFEDRKRTSWQRFTDVTGLDRDAFTTGWAQWLAGVAQEPGVAARLDAIPSLDPVIEVDSSDPGLASIVAGYRSRSNETELPDHFESGECILRYGSLGAFDSEYDVDDEDERVAECRIDDRVHQISGRHASGDRVYVALEYESALFHQPVRLGSRRLEIP